MKILIPDTVLPELATQIQAAAPDIVLIPYSEEEIQPIAGQEEVVGILRWIAGKATPAWCVTAPYPLAAYGQCGRVPCADTRCQRKNRVDCHRLRPAFEIAISEFVLG